MRPPDRETYLLQEAIRKAKAGNRSQARDLFLYIVEGNPNNHIAWLWLSGLLDDLDDQIAALENALAINPALEQARARLERLRQRQANRRKARWAKNQAAKAERLVQAGKRERAKRLLLRVVETYDENEKTWLLLSELVEGEEDQITALQNVLTLNPKNKAARARLETLLHFRRNLFDLAERYKEEGQFDKAIEVYHRAAMKARSRREWDIIYKNIDWLERRIASGIRHIHPNISIARLTPGPFLLYSLLLMVHNGLNPFAFTPGLWLGGLAVLTGGFFLAVAGVRSRHPIWVKVFGEAGGGGSRLARFTLGLAGWTLIGIAFSFLILSSLERLEDYYTLFGPP